MTTLQTQSPKKNKSRTKIIVLDDDPTGSQTVHSCLLLTKWDVETLQMALQDETSPLFFVLTNTRGMSATRAATVTREVCRNLKLALALAAAASTDISTDASTDAGATSIVPILVSRSDSTLRGHYPVEPNVIAEELGPFDAHFLVPAFFEGGRITRNSTHYLVVDNGDKADGRKKEIPCHETEFAKDSVFGYTTAYLPDYVEEKTHGAIPASQVERFLLADVRGDATERLCSLRDNVCCVVDGETQKDLDHFGQQLQSVAAQYGRKFLFRSGASLLTALAQLPPQPIPPEAMNQYVVSDGGVIPSPDPDPDPANSPSPSSSPHDGNRPRPGAIVVGSHVQKTTDQLNELLTLQPEDVVGIEVDVRRIQEAVALEDKNTKEAAFLLEALQKDILQQVYNVHTSGRHPAIYTSRIELSFATLEERLNFGERVSAVLMAIVQGLPPTLGFLISKGGITTNDVLSVGLALRTSRVVGQILPGCSVVRCPETHPRYPNLPVVIFPGNVGDATSLTTAFRRLVEACPTTTAAAAAAAAASLGKN